VKLKNKKIPKESQNHFFYQVDYSTLAK
jgi:hypothetical protein